MNTFVYTHANIHTYSTYTYTPEKKKEKSTTENHYFGELLVEMKEEGTDIEKYITSNSKKLYYHTIRNSASEYISYIIINYNIKLQNIIIIIIENSKRYLSAMFILVCS